MAPRHGVGSDESMRKRLKTTETPESRSTTPAKTDSMGKINFQVVYPNVNANGMLSEEEEQLFPEAEFQASPFVAKGALRENELDQYFAVVPAKEWADMKKYSNFVIQDDTYRADHFVYVRGEQTPKRALDKDEDFWIARILQVKAANPQHVYALVAWMYWPKELPPPKKKAFDTVRPTSGQRKYHGNYELIASNYMEVLDVLTFAGKADVLHWDEDPNTLTSKLYWRQTLCRETQELSKIQEQCICGGHYNPDTIMEICDNPSCQTLLHHECLIDDILTRTYNSKVLGNVDSSDGSLRANVKRKTPIWRGKFSAQVIGPPDEGGYAEVTITDLRPGSIEPHSWNERIQCLKCGSYLE